MATGSGAPPLKRIRVQKTKHPNPLFEKWLTEWKEEAKAKGSQIAFTFAKALTTLRKYPLPLNSGKECGLLKNFGTRLCVMLDRQLAIHRAANPTAVPALPAPMLPSPAKKPRAPAKKKPAPATTVVSGTSADPPPARKPAARKKKAAASDDSPMDMAPSASTADPQNVLSIPQVIVRIPAGAVEVRLLVDCGETSKGSKKASKVATKRELESQGIPFEIRSLSVGDFMWVATYDNHELVLPYIVERKRNDDLAQSIKDKRYYEQKWRLKATGFNVIYLIETINCFTCLPQETLYQAESNTEINDKFCIHSTSSVKETVSYLATMTKVLQKKFQNKTLISCGNDQGPEYSLSRSTLYLYAFKEFNDGAAKIEHFTVREMFAQQLLQISGASVDAVCALVELYPTPALLREAFSACASDQQCLGLLTTFQFGTLRRSLPPEVARRIWLFYTTLDFNNVQLPSIQ